MTDIDIDALEVTQADREAMRSILWVQTIIDDEEAIAQAFARHRQQSIASYRAQLAAGGGESIAELLEAAKLAERFIDGVMSFYGSGLEIANWHHNGETEPFDVLIIDENQHGEKDELETLRAAISNAELGQSTPTTDAAKDDEIERLRDTARWLVDRVSHHGNSVTIDQDHIDDLRDAVNAYDALLSKGNVNG